MVGYQDSKHDELERVWSWHRSWKKSSGHFQANTTEASWHYFWPGIPIHLARVQKVVTTMAWSVLSIGAAYTALESDLPTGRHYMEIRVGSNTGILEEPVLGGWGHGLLCNCWGRRGGGTPYHPGCGERIIPQELDYHTIQGPTSPGVTRLNNIILFIF